MRQIGDETTLIVMESDASTPAGLERCPPDHRTATCIEQRANEEPGAFMARVFDQIADLEKIGTSITGGAVICNERTDPQQLASRELMTHALASALSRAGGRRLVLSVDPKANSDVRLAVLELFEQLLAADRPGLEVRMRLESPKTEPAVPKTQRAAA